MDEFKAINGHIWSNVNIWGSVYDQITAQIPNQLYSQVSKQVRYQVWIMVTDQVRLKVFNYG